LLRARESERAKARKKRRRPPLVITGIISTHVYTWEKGLRGYLLPDNWLLHYNVSIVLLGG
jgi:hypothetical protein